MKSKAFLFGIALLVSAIAVKERVDASGRQVETEQHGSHASSQSIAVRHEWPSDLRADRTEAMMARRGVASFVTGFCAFAVTAVHADVGDHLEVAIRLRVDPSIVSRRITERLKTETEAIWGPYGIRLAWTNAGASESPGNSVSLEASVERRFERRQGTGWPAVLGLAFVEPDAPIRGPIRVSFEATERLLADRTTSRHSTVGIVLDPELARALGRVLAHEIGHVLLGPPYHDQAGLMRASFRPDELAEPDRTPFRLTCSGVDRLRSRLRALSGDSQLEHQHNSTTLDVEGYRGTRSELPIGASCIGTTRRIQGSTSRTQPKSDR